MFERYSFVALTTRDLLKARHFWAAQLRCPVTQEQPGEFFIVDVGGLRLCVDLADGKAHIAGSTDPTIGLKVRSVAHALQALAQQGFAQNPEVVHAARGSYAIIHDPDGRAVILTEAD
jgi:catechol 2,3-dioxygenase-like lactoylglutathione lyase family enzyme